MKDSQIYLLSTFGHLLNQDLSITCKNSYNYKYEKYMKKTIDKQNLIVKKC